jgi:hypothetical protein
MRSDYKLYEQFAQVGMLNEKFDPWVRVRKPAEYAQCRISDSADGEGWWYSPFVGVEFLAELRFETWNEKRRLVEVHPVRLTKTKINHGRPISAKHIVLL